MRSCRFAKITLALLASASALSAAGTAFGWERPSRNFQRSSQPFRSQSRRSLYPRRGQRERTGFMSQITMTMDILSVIDSRTDKIIKTIQTGGGTNSATVNEQDHHITQRIIMTERFPL